MSTYRARSAAEQFSRTFTLLAWYRNNPGAEYTQASKALGIPVVQIKKELRELTFCGLPGHDMGSLIDISLGHFSPAIHQTAGLGRPMNLSPIEAGVLLFHLESIRGALPEDLQPVVQSTKAKLESMAMAGRARKESQRYPGNVAENNRKTRGTAHSSDSEEIADQHGTGVEAEAPSAAPSLNALLEQAIKERREITVVYHSLSSDTWGTRVLRPDAIGAINGNYYLWARPGGDSASTSDSAVDSFSTVDSQESTVRTFSMARMQLPPEVTDGRQAAASILGAPGSAGPKAAINIDSTDPFGITKRYDKALLKLGPKALWMIEYYAMEEVGQADDGCLLVHMPDTGEWFTRFLVAYAGSVSVVEPVSLSDRIRRRAHEGLEAYSRLHASS